MWLQYFLNGVARQAEDALSRAERTNKLLEQWRHKLASDGHANVASKMVDLWGQPVSHSARCSATPWPGMQHHHACHWATREARDSERRQRGKRDRVYCAKKLLQIFEEPTQQLGLMTVRASPHPPTTQAPDRGVRQLRCERRLPPKVDNLFW